MHKFATLIVVVLFVVGSLADDEKSKSRAVSLTDKAMGGVKNAANKGAKNVEKLADGVTVQVERFTNPPQPHESHQSNLLVSAGRGVGRLLHNVTLEAGRFVGNIGGSAINLVRHSGGALRDTFRDTANRLSASRKSVQSKSKQASGDDNSAAQGSDSSAASEERGQEPNELQRSD